jgi:hypothetical protein
VSRRQRTRSAEYRARRSARRLDKMLDRAEVDAILEEVELADLARDFPHPADLPPDEASRVLNLDTDVS